MTDYSQMSDEHINRLVSDELVIPVGDKFCSDPEVAWPLIEKNLIGLKPHALYVGGSTWFASKGDGDFGIKFADKNPLRAAMIVFLMMQDSSNANPI